VKVLRSVVVALLILTTTAGVTCTLACPHETVRTFCLAGQHDCCPKQTSGSAEACLSANFTFSAKQPSRPALTALGPICPEAVSCADIVANQQEISTYLLNTSITAQRSVVLRI